MHIRCTKGFEKVNNNWITRNLKDSSYLKCYFFR